ncbi:tetraspanin-18-like isoform X2 [Gigantopelta aegis]|uniref:tetraspanin-18-like isoform X2 n=1 Tax=Gigantopelta aegis TaxID=1735272 RepID=UPI001B8886E8|nr:tetraspanin-18-like isoform X2 [Gigantopelta aegis]
MGAKEDPPDTIDEIQEMECQPLQNRRQSSKDSSCDEYKAKKVRRANEDNCTTCLRGTLHCYNVCILVIGCAALGVGIWLLVTDFGARKVTPIVGNQLYEVTTYLLIAGGGSVALLAFCGCCGTIREDKCVLSFYGTTLAIVLIVLGVASGLAFFFRGVLATHIQGRMKHSLTEQYGVDTRSNSENRRVTDAWDAMQRQLQCCGVEGNVSSLNSWAFYFTNTLWFQKEKEKGTNARQVPDSCCRSGDKAICTGQTYFAGPPNHINAHDAKRRKKNPYLYTEGCYDNLESYLMTYAAVAGIVAAVVPLFLVFGIIISFCLCARVSGSASEDEVDL